MEEVDFGEPEPRTVISGLVKHVPLEAMQQRLCIFLCNLKPAKMRGIISQAMVMCAALPGADGGQDRVEILRPPASAQIGERVVVPGYEGKPDDVLKKKNVWESVQPLLRTDDQRRACFRGIPWAIRGEAVYAETVTNGVIR